MFILGSLSMRHSQQAQVLRLQRWKYLFSWQLRTGAVQIMDEEEN